MLKFRVVHSEDRRALLTHHGARAEYMKLEVLAPEGGLSEYMPDGAFFDVHLHPEGAAPHPHAGDDSSDLGTAEEEIDTTPEDPEMVELQNLADAESGTTGTSIVGFVKHLLKTRDEFAAELQARVAATHVKLSEQLAGGDFEITMSAEPEDAATPDDGDTRPA